MEKRIGDRFRTWLLCGLLFLMQGAGASAMAAQREEGEFRILSRGEEIGTEHYVLAVSGDSASSSSIVEFRNPLDSSQRVKMESNLEMDGRYRPRSYRLKSDLGNKKGTIVGTFPPKSAIFEYVNDGTPAKKGLLLGENYTILDTNIFHHFTFLARLYRLDSKEKVQSFQVVIPQEADSGVVKMSELSKETILVKGKKMDARHLQVDSGSLIIHLWVDDQKALQKISVPSSGIEVVRSQ